LKQYTLAIKKLQSRSDTTEHSYRPAIIGMLSRHGLMGLNEPKRGSYGMPDIKVLDEHGATLGHIECKAVGNDLTKFAQTTQGKRYLSGLPNLLLTDGFIWHWFVKGKLQEKTGLGGLPDLLGKFSALGIKFPTTPKALAQELATRARLVRHQVGRALEEGVPSFLHLLESFRGHLDSNIQAEGFADVLAQTLTYGEFTRWTEGAVPKSNPFLRNFLKAISRASEDAHDDSYTDLEWVTENIRALLERTEVSVVKGFGVGAGREATILHFYEEFLGAYDPAERRKRGVWYTPQPVVDYIVNQIDEKVKDELGKPDGLADPSVVILDPACGTGTFLHAVVKKIRDTVGVEDFPSYVKSGNLIQRLVGFELMMAPYSIAHLSLLHLLRSYGADVPDQERLSVYLTDTLGDDIEHGEGIFGLFGDILAKEADAAQERKTGAPILVILGNPPYNGASTNKGAWITGLIGDYKKGLKGERNSKWLQDDYVKFWRFAQWQVNRNPKTLGGVVGFVTPHGFMDAPTFRGMRSSLLGTFDTIDVVDLHGNANKREVAPNGGKDENVFNIRQGVGITIAVNRPGDAVAEPEVQHADVWGLRKEKFEALEGEVGLTSLGNPTGPMHLFVPTVPVDPEYAAGWSVKDVFPVGGSGIQTHRDKFVVGFTPDEIRERFTDFSDMRQSDSEIREKYNLKDNRDWNMSEARKRIAAEEVQDNLIVPICYRPLDTRIIYLSSREIDRPRTEVMQHLQPQTGNLALTVTRQLSTNRGFLHVGVADHLLEGCTLSSFSREGCYGFPLYLLPDVNDDDDDLNPFLVDTKISKPRPNLNPDFIRAFSQATGLTFDPADPRTRGDGFKTIWTPLDLLHYVYGLLHSPTYREGNKDALKRDFPQIIMPTPETLPRVRNLATAGRQLIALHLTDKWSEHPDLARGLLCTSTLKGEGDDVVVKPVYKGGSVWINKEQRFEGVPQEAWDAYIGGYQPAQKWLKDRKKRILTYDDILHYRRIIQVLLLTQEIRGQLK